MSKFTKGYTYIVECEGKDFYIVKQTSMRTWIALEFGTLVNFHIFMPFKSGNGVDLFKELSPIKTRSFRNIGADLGRYRKQMFQILKYGEMGEI